MKRSSMILNYLDDKPIIGVVASIYTFTMANINPDEMILKISTYGGVVVVLLAIISHALNIYHKIKDRKK